MATDASNDLPKEIETVDQGTIAAEVEMKTEEKQEASEIPAGLASDAGALILRQIEFYFCDSNLPRDRFLLEKMKENPEGFIDVALLCSFARMRTVLKVPSPSEIPADKLAYVASILRDSKTLKLSDDDTKVRRTAPLADPEAIRSEIDKRSIYVSPFPRDSTMEGLTSLFSEHGPVNCVRLRRHAVSSDFKGSIFVEFDSEETCAAVLAKNGTLVHDGAELEMMPKLEYLEKREIPADTLDDVDVSEAEAEEAEELEYEAGLLIKFTIEEGTEEISREDLKEALGKYGTVRWVQYQKGQTTGHLQFEKPEEASAALVGVEESPVILSEKAEKVEKGVRAEKVGKVGKGARAEKVEKVERAELETKPKSYCFSTEIRVFNLEEVVV
eukprot:gene8700-10322_t